MNYAYGAEQFELNPVVLRLEKIYYPDGKTVDQARTNDYAADPARFKGVLGTSCSRVTRSKKSVCSR